MNEFETQLREALYQSWRDGRDGLDRYDSVNYLQEIIKQAVAKHIIGEDVSEDHDVPLSRIIQNDATVGIDQVDRQKVYNELMADQRKRLNLK